MSSPVVSGRSSVTDVDVRSPAISCQSVDFERFSISVSPSEDSANAAVSLSPVEKQMRFGLFDQIDFAMFP